MTLKEELCTMPDKKVEDTQALNYEIFSSKVENMFRKQNFKDLKPGCRVILSLTDRKEGDTPQKVLSMAFYLSENQDLMVDVPEFMYDGTDNFMKDLTWNSLQGWCKKFSNEAGFGEPEIDSEKHLISVVF